MPFARIWFEPTGVKITFLVDDADIEQVAAVLKKDGQLHPAATFTDVGSQIELDSLIPPDRSQRHKWRKALVGRGVRIDPTVPDLPTTPVVPVVP